MFYKSKQIVYETLLKIVPQEGLLHFPLRAPLGATCIVGRSIITIAMFLKIKGAKAAAKERGKKKEQLLVIVKAKDKKKPLLTRNPEEDEKDSKFCW